MVYIQRLVIVCLSVFSLVACQKEYSAETGGAGVIPGGPGGGTPLANYGWSFTGTPSGDYHGCIDDASYEVISGKKALFIEGSDSANNSFNIIYLPLSGTFTPGTYGMAQGATFTLTDKDGNLYMPTPSAGVTIQITKVNDTLIEATFSGTLTDVISNTTFKINGGKIKALIGKQNPCGGTPTGPSTGDYFPTSTNSNWVYYFSTPLDEDSVFTISRGATRSVNGQTYNLFEDDLLGFLYRKSSGNYHRYGPVDFFDFIDSSQKADVIFLKDNVPAGTSWESGEYNSNLQGVPVKFKRKFTITQKDVTVTVLGASYSNVITVKEEMLINAAGVGYQAIEETILQYAKGVGLIHLSNDVFEVTVDLKRYRVF